MAGNESVQLPAPPRTSWLMSDFPFSLLCNTRLIVLVAPDIKHLDTPRFTERFQSVTSQLCLDFVFLGFRKFSSGLSFFSSSTSQDHLTDVVHVQTFVECSYVYSFCVKVYRARLLNVIVLPLCSSRLIEVKLCVTRNCCCCCCSPVPGGVSPVGHSRSGGLWQTEASVLPRHRRHPHVLFHR